MFASGGFNALLEALSLSQGLFKPTPGALNLLADTNQSSTVNDSSNSIPIYHDTFERGESSYATSQPAAPFDASYGHALSAADNSCQVAVYNSPPVDMQMFPPFDQAQANVYRYRQQQSVNLGSWFVHESWMTPSVFTCASGPQIAEIDIASGWGSTDSARSVLERHWDTFINQSDFQYLASIGINTVRLPIGYWSLGSDFCKNTPFDGVADVYQYSWPRVVRAINMAGQAGIGVLVDLHGAVGSQNGQAHSGISDGATHLFDDPSNIAKTMDVLTFLMQQLVNVSNVVGIQILNEPQNVDSLADFYTQAITTMREAAPGAEGFPLYLHDGFDLNRFSTYVANRTDFVVEDHHSYFVFTPSDESEPASQHTSDIQSGISHSLATASTKQGRNLVVDEWSCALTDQSLSNEDDPEQARQEFCTEQMNVYGNTTAGWSFWSYRKEDCNNDPGWCFTAAVGRSLPSTFFSYNNGGNVDPSKLPSLMNLTSDMPSVNAVSSDSQPIPTETAGSYPSYPPVPSSTPYKRAKPYRLQRRASSSSRPMCSLRSKRDNSGQPSPSGPSAPSPSSDSPTQQAITKGYSDGFLTAKIFALYGMSKLGFIGQYIRDSLVTLGPSAIAPGTEGYYSDWFVKGLADGEAVVTSQLDNT